MADEKKPDWIGKLIKDGSPIAVLGRDGMWKADDEATQVYLNSAFNALTSPALGLPPGRAVVSQAAAKMEAEAVFAEELKPLPPGVLS